MTRPASPDDPDRLRLPAGARPDARLGPDRRLTTDADLEEFLGLLLRGAIRRQLWLIMLGPDDRVTGPLMPMDDYPQDPGEPCDTEDLGRAPSARVLADRAAFVCRMVGGRAIVLVWERPGPDKFTPADLAWAGAMARECAAAGARLRAQFVLHDGGVRPLTADDYG